MRPLAAAVSAAVTSLVVTMLLIGEAESSAPPGGVGSDRLEVYLVEVGPSDVELLAAAGVDTTHLPDLTEGGRVEIVATSRQARALRHQGLSVRVKKVNGRKASDGASQTLAAGQAVYRSYSEPGGIRDELRETAAAAPRAHQARHDRTDRAGQADPRASRSPRTPRTATTASARRRSTCGAQHAREWITPEMTRRLMHHVLDSYGTDPSITKLVNTHRAVVPAGRQPRRLRLHVHRGQPAVAQEPARQQRRRPDHRRRRRRPQPQLRLQVGLRQRGLLARPGQRDLPRHRPRTPSRRPRRSTGCSSGSASSSSSTTTRPPSCCSTASAGRSARRRPDDVIYEAMAGDDAEPGGPRLRPGHLRRALHHQRRHRHARDGRRTARSASPRR